MTNPLGDIFDSLGVGDPRKRGDKGPPPLPQIRGKRIDGVLYVHASDVADALAQLAPTVNKRLIDKFRGAVA